MDMSLIEAFDRASKDTEAILDEDEDDDDVKVQLVAEESLQVVEESQPEVPAAQSDPLFVGADESQGVNHPSAEPLDSTGRSYSSAQPPAWLDGAQPRAISSGDGCGTLSLPAVAAELPTVAAAPAATVGAAATEVAANATAPTACKKPSRRACGDLVEPTGKGTRLMNKNP